MNLVFWMTPITYPLESIPEKYRLLAFLNPLTSLMSLWRGVFLNNHLDFKILSIASATAVLFLWAGFAIFRKLEKRLDEVL